MDKPKNDNCRIYAKHVPVKGKVRTLGPVGDLEAHVAPDWWCRIFNSTYLKTDGDVVDDQRITRTEIDLIVETLKLTTDSKTLDLCCGQGRHTLELARRGFRNMEGLDRSYYLIQKAKEQAKSQNLSVKFREGDARKLPYAADTFDCVLVLGNSFGYFETLQDDLQVLKEIRRVLKPWGRLLIDIADGDYLKEHFQSRSWEWIDNNLFVCRERSLSLDNERLVSREVVTHVTKGVIADQFYAERLYSQKSLSRLLTEAGFSDLAFPVTLAPDSQRAQDLGMMERRILTTAQVRKEWSASLKTKKNGKHVVVLLGDPHKPDPLKPLCVFDDDDFYTIDKMKSALQELKGYHFTYLNNHDTLIRDLANLTGKVDLVLNLCDEGFFNDPRKELHVTSVLEILGIPYTGAGPQCLAFCYDKSLVRGVAKEIGIPVPKAFFIRPEDSSFEFSNLDFPVIVKPNLGDSSFGITAQSVAYQPEELIDAIQEIRKKFGYERPILVEEFLPGKDLTVGLLGTPPNSSQVLPIMEEDYSSLPPELPKICGYEAKWCPDSPYWKIKSIPAELPEETEKTLVQWCMKLSERLECRDYVRLDWRLDAKGTPKLLEVNPNPGWCWDGHLAKMAARAGITYPDLLGQILHAAEERLNIEDSRELAKEEEKEERKETINA
jgi:D-alanine-D-alanine ligase